MNRRDAISRVALLLGGTVIGSSMFLTSGCQAPLKRVDQLFEEDQIKLMDEIADTILPETKTPGAKAAKVGAFMALMVNDCYDAHDQKIFLDGLVKVQETFREKYGTDFTGAAQKDRTEFLTGLDLAQKSYTENKKPTDANHYFRMMKELTLLGYFTSEIGCTKAQRYVLVPGKYDGNFPYKKGDRAWAS